ncbi:MAG: multi-sensor signal transduction multi-kinase [Bacilli bacterium]|nr:multi-sensor signal transduction multi-kinase [Bacilli bacterium]
MIQIPGYEIKMKIHESVSHIIYRGKDILAKRPVILKMLKTEYPLSADISKIKHEYEITRNLSIPGIVKILTITMFNNAPILVMEDFNGQSLKSYLNGQALDLSTFLSIALQLVETLGMLQQSQVIHKDLKSDNIIIHPETTEVKITDFSISTALSRETTSMFHLNQLEGTLGYISPEQTGRMNRAIDYRTDFYSLGVTFYEMLAGQLPFQSKDPLELIHCHIARKPVPLNQMNIKVPQALSDIVMKCLAKNAEERYQSTYGLYADLQKCWDQRDHPDGIPAFIVGEEDRSETLQIPQKLYGREQELLKLQHLFEQVSYGTQEIILISGYSGTGKSSLVYEVHKSIIQKHGYFIAGKFDQYKRDIPYYCFVSAFRDLIRQLLTENEAQIALWKLKLLTAFGQNGSLLIDIIPELKIIVGEQPPVPELPSSEAQNRLQRLFVQFIQVFLQSKRPLCLFFDDLQWADTASLSLLKVLLTDIDGKHFLLIGAYRDQEVKEGHPLALTIEEIKKSNVAVNEIKLEPLNLDHISTLISETLHCSILEAIPLANLIDRKTEGNPFFVIQFVKSLYEDHLLAFDFNAGRWRWDITRIEGLDITDNVVELMLQRLLKLSEETRMALKYASCIGNVFNLKTLAIVTGQAVSHTASSLWEALREGLIVPLEDHYKFVHSTPEETTDWDVTYRFLHDRVQQAAYALIPQQEKQQTHLTIGRLLYERAKTTAWDDILFDVANHFNQSIPLLTDVHERNDLAGLNLAAGKKAKASCAYTSASAFFSCGIQLLEPTCWKYQYDLTFALHLELAETQYSCGFFDESEELMRIGLAHAKTRMEKALLFNLMITLHTNMARYQDAVNLGFAGLKLFGISFPAQPGQRAILREYFKSIWLIGRKSIDHLYHLPEMTDPDKIIILQLVNNMAASSFFINPNLYIYGMLNALNLSLKYGLHELSATAFLTYGITLGSVFGNFKLGQKFGELSLRICDKYNNPVIQCKTYFAFANFINHWRNHIQSDVQYLKKSYQLGIESGDLIFSGYAVTFLNQKREFKGDSLIEIGADTEKWLPFLQQRKIADAGLMMLLMQRFVALMQGRTNGVTVLENDQFDEESYVAQLQATLNKVPLHTYYITKLQIHYLFGEYSVAVRMAEQSEALLSAVIGLQSLPKYHFYAALTRAALYSTASAIEQSKLMNQLKGHRKKLRRWALQCADNFLHLELLVAAEIARLQNKPQKAAELFDQAIASASSHSYLQIEAIGNELAAQFYIGRGMHKIARSYITEAYYRYHQWGAIEKARVIRAKFPHLLLSDAQETKRGDLFGDINLTISLSASQRDTGSQKLDLTTIVKASQTLSGEIKLEQLLEKLLGIVIENAGAEKGFLILEKEGRLFVEAESNLEQEHLIVMHSEPVESSTQLCAAIVQYAARTREDVVLDYATHEGIFTQDAYVIQNQPKSILCIPILHQGDLMGILYLENNLSTGVFTENHLEVLKLLSSQFAISIENARLYASIETSKDEISKWNQELEQKVSDRTSDLEQALDTVKQTQKQLVQSEKMVALGGLVAGVAHEINTPIGIGVTAISYLVQKTADFSDLYRTNTMKKSDLEHYLQASQETGQIILTNLQRASELIRSFKQVAVDQSSDTKRRFNMKTYLNEIILSLGMNLNKAKHHVVCHCDEDLEIFGDPGALSQVVTNFVMNSIIHAFDPDVVGTLEFHVSRTENRLFLRYSDNGKGMPPAVLEKIFDPFFTTNRGNGGTGLGMHIVYNIVTQSLHGNIKCASIVTKGTTFMIDFPIESDNELRKDNLR